MSKEMETLKDRLYGNDGLGAKNVKIFRGSSDASSEEVASQINKALDQIAAGDFDVVDFDDLD